MSLYVDKQYTSKNSTPLAWHTFTRFVRCPLGTLSVIGVIIALNDGIQINELGACIDIMLVIYIGLQVTFFIGSFEWKRYAWKAMIISLFYSVIMLFCIYAIAYGDDISSYGSLIGTSIIAYLEYVYYKKRELLFDGKNTDEVKNNASSSNNCINIGLDEKISVSLSNDGVVNKNDNNEKNDNILYCRKCGTKLEKNSVYCRKCGTKVEGLNEKM